MTKWPRYSVYQVNGDRKAKHTVGVLQNGRLCGLKDFDTREDAQDHAQRLVEDDNWHSMNR
jgi:hypothetical protein